MADRIARRLTLGAVLALVSSACNISSTTVPPLAGPSTFALSFAVTATPDSILQDGASQASITVTARDANAKGISGLTFRMDMFVGGVAGDYGKLSGKTIVTGADGKANAVYTSPPPPAAGAILQGCAPLATGIPLPGTCVTISATPISTGFGNGTVSQTVVIHLVPIGIVLPPANTPTPQFVITPTPVSTGVATNFDGSASCAGGATGTPTAVCNPTSNTIVSYQWGFGDGGAAMGRTTSHSYSTPGSYTVSLTVTNDGGKFATTSQTITVAASAVPSAAFVFSPASPGVGQVIQFNASTSTAVAGHSIVSYVWNWGDGATGSGQLASHSYTAAGTYTVTLSVVDDAGQMSTTSTPVTVTSSGGGTGTATAAFTFSPASPNALQTVFFNASTSTGSAGHAITIYAWDFGDGVSALGVSVSHSYAAAGVFTVTLTVTDDAGQKGNKSAALTVTAPGSGTLTAGFTASPTNPVSGTLVSFNANTSTPLANITQFDWDFGDGTIINNGGMIINHTFNTPVNATFTIRLTVHDNTGKTAVATQALSVTTIGGDPTAAFTITPNPVAPNVNATFTSTSSAGAGVITNLTWDFGDGSPIVTGNPVNHQYSVRGTYTITLTVTQTDGRRGTTSHTLLVQ
jgi:PKD repeat protein